MARRLTVAVLDADPQCSLVVWSGFGDGVLRDMVQPVDATHPRQFCAVVDSAAARATRVLIDVLWRQTVPAAPIRGIALPPLVKPCQKLTSDYTGRLQFLLVRTEMPGA